MVSRTQKLLLTAQILLILTVFLPPTVLSARTVTLSVDPSSGAMTYPTYTINIIVSPVTELNSIHFMLSFNDGTDFLDVPTGNVELGTLFAGKQPIFSTGIYHLSDTGLSYVNVLIEMPGNETVASAVSQSVAKITFKLLANAMPGMTSLLKLEWADAIFYVGGTNPYEYIDSGSIGGITLPTPGTLTLDYLVTTLTINPAAATVEKPVTLSSTIKDGGGNPIASLSIGYYVDTMKIGSALTDDFGISSISYTPLNVGTFTIKAEYVGNLLGGKYASSSDTDSLTVSKMSTTLSLTVQSSIKVNDEVDVAATLKKDGTIMVGSTVSFSALPPGGGWTSIGSDDTNSSGIAVVRYRFSSQGLYEIKAEYSGTPNYAPSSDTTTRMVSQTRTTIKLTAPPTSKVDQQITFSATLKNETGAPLSGRLISFYVNTQLIDSAPTGIDGSASITYVPSEASPPEGWKVEARYAGDPTYSSSVDTVTIVVNKLATTLTFDVAPTTIAIEDTTVMTVTLKDENTKAIPSASIDYYVKVETRWTKIDSKPTDGNGIASLDYSPTTTGTLLVKANYTGSSRYSFVESELTIITVNKLATSLSLSMPTTAKVEQTIMISATLDDENQKAIPTVTIEYFLLSEAQEQAIGSAKTDQTGVASIPYTLLSVGTFQIKATFSESAKYLASSNSRALTVNSLTTSLTVSKPATARVGDTIALAATLKDENQNALQGLAVEYFIYSGGTWNTIGAGPIATNSSGVATVDYTPSEAGTFRIRAEFGGDTKHLQTTSQEVTLTVNKVQTALTIILSNTTTTTQTSIKISATLMDEDDEPISRSNVYYQIFKAGEWTGIGSATTNLQGIASMYFQPTEAGTLRIKAVYNGDTKYTESTSEEASLEVTGAPGSPLDLGFLTDDKLTVLDLLFWAIVMLAFSTLVIVAIRRKIKSTEKQTSVSMPPITGR